MAIAVHISRIEKENTHAIRAGKVQRTHSRQPQLLWHLSQVRREGDQTTQRRYELRGSDVPGSEFLRAFGKRPCGSRCEHQAAFRLRHRRLWRRHNGVRAVFRARCSRLARPGLELGPGVRSGRAASTELLGLCDFSEARKFCQTENIVEVRAIL